MKIRNDNGNTESSESLVKCWNSENFANYKSSSERRENSTKPVIENLKYQINSNNVNYDKITDSVEIVDHLTNSFGKKIIVEELNYQSLQLKDDVRVCNTQYKVNKQNNINLLKSCGDTETTKVEGVTQIYLTPTEKSILSSNGLPTDEDGGFKHTDSEDMSENDKATLPRGIVNPNYPGFQHLAHTLQDYSTNIENFYHSENDMTDDDIDLEMTESSNDTEINEKYLSIEITNNNNNKSTLDALSTLPSHSDLTKTNINNCTENEIPDLIRTISKNNNNIKTMYDLPYSETDIECTFNTEEIIGNFNKEIEDEIKHLLNYNIVIQDDLNELRKDIKDNFAEPIENTINNISDVVNQVIKKLVETQSDNAEHPTDKTSDTENGYASSSINNNCCKDTIIEFNKRMNITRPTFLLLDINTSSKIVDAVLSDGKEEIIINENDYVSEGLSNNVENTIKQLSSELRKIIPKLDEMREQDKIWTEKNIDGVNKSVSGRNINEITDNNGVKSTTQTNCTNICRLVEDSSRLCGSSLGNSVNQEECIKKQPYTHADENNRSVQSNNNNNNFEDFASFDVYNIETALPKLDLDALENHLKAAKEAERRKRNDREEIRKLLAMGADHEEYYSMGHTDRPGKKPSLHSRLQSGKNLQICFMNETASDNESQCSDIENVHSSDKLLPQSSTFSISNYSLNNHPYQTRPLSVNITKDKKSSFQSGSKLRPSTLSNPSKTPKSKSSHSIGHVELKESDFLALQTTLQTEARIALAQAKELARLQMERERRTRPVSPVTEMLQKTMEKANAPLAPDRRRVSRQLLTDMNIAQLQVIVNELHSQIEELNENLVKLLMARDELHMSQDSQLVDIEDLTRYLGVKQQSKKTKGNTKTSASVRKSSSFMHK